MSELGKISAELRDVLAKLDQALQAFSSLDRGQLGAVEATLAKRSETRHLAHLVADARRSIRDAERGVRAAQRAGNQWVAAHGGTPSGDRSKIGDAHRASTAEAAVKRQAWEHFGVEVAAELVPMALSAGATALGNKAMANGIDAISDALHQTNAVHAIEDTWPYFEAKFYIFTTEAQHVISKLRTPSGDVAEFLSRPR